MYSPPVAGCSECGDGVKLRGQRVLNDVKGRQDGRILREVERLATERVDCPTDVLQNRGTKWSSFDQQSIGIFGVGEPI